MARKVISELDMTKVNALRILVLDRHLSAEKQMDTFLTRFFLEDRDGDSLFSDLVLAGRLSFSAKLGIIGKIFQRPDCRHRLESLYVLVRRDGKEVVYKTKRGKVNCRQLVRDLEALNDARNHLLHNVVLDTAQLGTIGRPFRGSRIDAFQKGRARNIEALAKRTTRCFEAFNESRVDFSSPRPGEDSVKS